MSHLDQHTKKIYTLERALDRTDARYRLICETLPYGIQECDSEGLITFSNPAHSKMHGYDEGELLGWRIWELLADESERDELRKYLAYLVSEQPHPTPYFSKCRTRSGGTIDVQVDWTYQHDEQGHVIGFVSILTDISERNKSEDELRNIFEMTVGMICVADIESATFTRINPEFIRVLGYSEEELLSRPFLDFIHPDDVEPTQQVIERELKKGKNVLQFENRYRIKTGQYRWLDWTSHANLDTGLIYAIAHDITERKQFEEEIDRQCQLLNVLIQTIPDAIYFKDLDGRNLIVNDALANIVGLEISEIVGMTDRELLPVDLANHASISDREVFRQREPIHFEQQTLRADGQRVTYDTVKAPVVDDSGNITAIVGVSRDITERKQIEDRLKDSEARYLDLYDNAPDMFASVDATTGKIVNCNNTLAVVTGYSKDELFAMPHVSNLYHPDSEEKREKVFASFINNSEVCNAELQLKHKDGSTIEVSLSASAICDKSGNVVLSRSILRDITERKQAEKQIQTNNIVLKSISRVQQEFLVEADPNHSFEKLLAIILEVTASEYGFIGEILNQPGEKPYLKTYAVTNIAWNDETRAFYEQNATDGLEFYNLDSLYGAVLKTGEPVIFENVDQDRRRSRLPDGHPPLLTFLGLPFFHGDELIGMVGIANRAGGYDEDILKTLEPIQATCSSLMHAYRLESQREQAELEQYRSAKALEESERRYRHIVEDQTELIVRWLPDGERIFANRAYCDYFGQSSEEVIGTSIFPTVKEGDLPAVRQKLTSLHIDHPVASDERRVITPNGKVRWNAWTDRAVFDDQNRLVEYQSVGRDITERKSREKLLSEGAKAAARMSLLTDREREILSWVVKGKANKIIAKQLSISERTVEKHRSNTMGKLQAGSTAELVRLALITGEILTTD